MSSAYLPIAAAVISDEIYQVIKAESARLGNFGTGYTYSGHPVPAASQTTQPGFATSDGPLAASETMSRRNRAREDGRSASDEGPAPAGSTLPHR